MSLADLQWCPTSVQVTVLQARGLRVKGKGGTNDAYAVMHLGKEKYQTSVVEKSVAPVWREEAAFDLPPLLLLHQGAGGGGGGGGAGERGTLRVHVLHRALVGPDKQLGQAVINLLQLSDDKTRSKTEWFKLLDKTGKADKDRGEVLVDIQFMRNNMTASMFDLSAAGKSRSRLGKFKDKVRGKKKDSDAASVLVPSFSHVLTDSEGEAIGDEEVAAGKDEKKKKHKMKSLFSSKSNLQKNMSQSMSVLPVKNSSLSGSQSSGLNMDPSEGKKKFNFKIPKRSGSSDVKDSSSSHQKHGTAEQSNLCINGSHVYREERQTRTSRIGSNFSLASSGHGSMEDVPESSPPSVESLQAVRQYSAWTEEEEEEEETAEVEHLTEDMEEHRKDEEEITRMEEERRRRKEDEDERKQEEAVERLAEQKRRQDEEERKRIEEEKVRREEEQRLRSQEEALERLAEEKRRQAEERKRIEEEEKVRREEEQMILRKRQEKEEQVRREEQQQRERLEEEKKRREEQERKRVEEERIRMEEERVQEDRRREESIRRREEECRLVQEKRKEEERIIEEEKVRKEEEQVRRREVEECEAKRKLQDQEKKQQEERIRKEEERRQEEEEKARKEKEEYERLAEERRKLGQKERERMEDEERIKREKDMRMEEEKMREEEEAERVTREVKEKRRLEEQERRKIEEAEKKKREEAERIMQEEEDRARKEKEEYEKLVEEKRKLEEQERRQEEERIRHEEEEKIRIEEERRRRAEDEERAKKEAMERLAEEKKRLEEQEKRRIEEEGKRLREEEERNRKLEEAEREKREEEARKLETEKLKEAEVQKKKDNTTKDGHKAAGKKPRVAEESPAGVACSNPFDETGSSNPSEDVPDSPAAPDSRASQVSKVKQGYPCAVSSVGSEPRSTDQRDLIGAQRDKRPAPQPPRGSVAESQREPDVSKPHQAQTNKQSNDKDVKTASVLPQRSVQVIAPLSRSRTDTKSPQSSMQGSDAKGAGGLAKHSKRPAPSRPSVEEELSSKPKSLSVSEGGGPETKQAPVVYSSNPFEDDEDDPTAQDDSPTPGSVHWPPPASQDAASQAKLKSSKMAHKAAKQTRAPQPEVTTSAAVQDTSLKEPQPARAQSTAEVTGVKKEGPPTTSRRLQPVKPLNPQEQNSAPVVQSERNNNSTEIEKKREVQDKTKILSQVNDGGPKGPYTQLTQKELISLVLKQEKQLSEKDKTIAELELYIDNLLVRVIEESPGILMSLNSMKRTV
ncbi:unnamed protein product [Pleuronectes platessa]|uniref:Rab11 family-interacting protein 1-like n=1 Tax=Pleuronectes platessa TaxID=8262 RepID=A0A9N7V8H1_PLEPL|nr:unnamed protein product [Pleuronectes platessa]